MFDNVDILVDLQTGAISMVINSERGDGKVELECVTADDQFAPKG